ncbi:MAG TPA: hypothetical protein VFA60_13905 [Terriglobales bacterium]|nr:hypothetical protein [Terriglobales bacterium]
MSDNQAGALVVFIILFMFLIVFSIWGSLVFFGIRAAKQKNRSPHWMWFGLHPVGALIIFIFMKVAQPLKICPKCAQKSNVAAVVCPFCQTPFAAAPGAAIAQGAAAAPAGASPAPPRTS